MQSNVSKNPSLNTYCIISTINEIAALMDMVTKIFLSLKKYPIGINIKIFNTLCSSISKLDMVSKKPTNGFTIKKLSYECLKNSEASKIIKYVSIRNTNSGCDIFFAINI